MALRTVFSMAGLNGAAAAFNAASALVATAALGPGDRGVMVIGLTVATFVALVGGLGTGVAFRARYPSSAGDERCTLVATYTWWSLAGTLVAPLAAVAAVAASAPFIDPRLTAAPFLVGVAVYTAGQILLTQLVEAWYADGRFQWAVASGAVMSAASFLAVMACLLTRRSPAVFILAQGVGTTAVCALVAARLHTVGLLRFGPVRFADLTRMLVVGVPALGVSAGLAVVLRADRYFLGVMAGPVAVGVYSLAATTSEFPRLLPVATGQLMLHQAATGGGAQESGRLLRTAVGTTAVGSLVVGGLGWLLIPRVFGPEFTGARIPLLILVVAEVFFSPYALASRGLLGAGRTRTAGGLGMAGAVVAVAVYPVAARVAGASGAAVASLLVYAGLSATSWTLLRRRFASGSVSPGDARAEASAGG